ncbi:MAG: sensor histidine kinase, partial [Candidatus Saccharimonadales bacterium]
AVKYTQEGSVTVRLQFEKDRAVILVQDTGIGIEPEKIDGIFSNMFERSETAKKTATGAGVGLYLSAQIIREHHGKVTVTSPGVGKGSTFRIELPVS